MQVRQAERAAEGTGLGIRCGIDQALDPRGELYSEDNIRQRLTLRNFMEELRSSGVDTGGPSSLSQKDRQAFANQLDRFLLSRHC